MIEVGKFNRLAVIKQVDFGVYLDGGQYDSILLPNRYVPPSCQLGDELDVFIHFDSEDMLIATTATPKAEVGQCAFLQVSDINHAGAFLDWGLPKDLLVPYNEQQKPMQVGYSYVVYVYLDEHTGLIVGSTKLSHHLDEQPVWLKTQQAVDLQIAGRTELGYKAVINNRALGLIHKSDAFRPLKIGEQLKGFVKAIRTDGKIDLVISQGNKKDRLELGEAILKYLAEHNGESSLTDTSHPEEIYRTFNVSKKKYKQALGTLYKNKKIIITPEKITLLNDG